MDPTSSAAPAAAVEADRTKEMALAACSGTRAEGRKADEVNNQPQGRAVRTDVTDGTASQADTAKRLATLRARAALAGVQLFTIDGDNGRPLYVVTRWALTRSFDELEAIATWLDLIGAPA